MMNGTPVTNDSNEKCPFLFTGQYKIDGSILCLIKK